MNGEDIEMEDKFPYQLTRWVKRLEEVQFAVDQLRKHNASYEIKYRANDLAVFTEGKELQKAGYIPCDYGAKTGKSLKKITKKV